MVHTRIPDTHRDLLDAEFATLATVGDDGYPQLSEVWFLAQDDQIALSLNTARQKLKNIETEPACTLMILDLANPYRYVEIRGTAVVEPDDDLVFARKVGTKYDGCGPAQPAGCASWRASQSSRHRVNSRTACASGAN